MDGWIDGGIDGKSKNQPNDNAYCVCNGGLTLKQIPDSTSDTKCYIS